MKLTGTPCHITRTMHPRVQATVKLPGDMIVLVGLLSWMLGQFDTILSINAETHGVD
jgi:hypothetical protein